MAIDISQFLNSPQLAAAKVEPRGTYWRATSRQSFSPLARLIAPLVARVMLGPKPVLGGAQTPVFDIGMLAVTIATENVTGGIGSAAFVAYLSRLCNPAFTATQYALLSALAAVSRTFIASGGGWFAERLGWAPFFTASTLLCVPGLLLLLFLMRRDLPPSRSEAA